MKLIDFLILAAIALAGIGAFLYLQKHKKSGGCGTGCSSCPHCGQCGSASKKDENETPGGR